MSDDDNGRKFAAPPVPDPTILTTEQLLREIKNLEKLFSTRYECLHEDINRMRALVDGRPASIIAEVGHLDRTITARLDAMDRAVTLIQKAVDRSPSIAEVNLSVEDLEKILLERINGIKTLIDVQFSLNSKAVDAAFAASKEAVSEQNKSNAASITKSEKYTTDQLNSLNEKIDDLKERVGGSEGRHKGVGDSWGVLLGAGGFMVAVVTLIILVIRSTHG